jgi:hypothetical protein
MKNLPDSITSYDILKSVAVLTMIADHIGYYVFPDQEWWRVIGRIGSPTWFFLVGYARSREISPALMVWASVLLVADGVVGIGIVPLNALCTIILMRLTPEKWIRASFRDLNNFLTAAVLLLIFYGPGFFLTEYGAEAFIIGWFGYAIRNRPRFENGRGERFIPLFCAVFFLLTYVVSEQWLFQFRLWPGMAMALGVAGTTVLLYRFRPATYPALSARLPSFLRLAIQLGGRRTMEIYGIHLILLKAVGCYLFPFDYPLFQFSLLNAAVFGASPPVHIISGKG